MKRKNIVFFSETYFDKFQSQMTLGADQAAQEENFNLIRLNLDSVFNRKKLTNQIDIISEMIGIFAPDGIMFLGWIAAILESRQKFVDYLKNKYSVPILSIGRKIENVHSISMGENASFREVMNHLIHDHGYRNIVFIEGANPDERYNVYEEMMRGYGIFNPNLVLFATELYPDKQWVLHKVRAKVIVDKYFSNNGSSLKIDALISLYTDEAVCLLEELNSRGIYVPRDVALVSWEDGERGRFSMPPITSVYYPFYEQGYAGIKMMRSLIEGENLPLLKIVPGVFRIRRSCGCNPLIENKVVTHHVQPEMSDSIAARNVKDAVRKLYPNIAYFDPDQLIDQFLLWLETQNEENFLLFIEQYLLKNKNNIEFFYHVEHDIFFCAIQ